MIELIVSGIAVQEWRGLIPALNPLSEKEIGNIFHFIAALLHYTLKGISPWVKCFYFLLQRRQIIPDYFLLNFF
jgi:hypothetical protein